MWFRGYGHLACKVLRVVKSLILVSILNRFLVHELVSRLYPRQEHKQAEPHSTTRNAQATWCKTWHDMRDVICNAYAPRSRTRLPALPKTRTQTSGTTLNNEKCASNMMQNMAWHAGCDMQCICTLRKEKIEPGINLANQVCRWKDEMISVKIYIKITGKGCTVCKWQAKQEWHNSAINSTMPFKMQQETKLLHSNVATKHMAVVYYKFLTKYEPRKKGWTRQ